MGVEIQHVEKGDAAGCQGTTIWICGNSPWFRRLGASQHLFSFISIHIIIKECL